MKIKYSPKRVYMLTRAILVENKRKSLYFYLVTTIVTIALSYPIALAMIESSPAEVAKSFTQAESYGLTHVLSIISIYALILTVTSLVITYNIFSSSLSKKKVLYKHLIPAMVAEKFTANMIVCQLFAPLLVLFSFISTIAFFKVFFYIFHPKDIVYSLIKILDFLKKIISGSSLTWGNELWESMLLGGLITTILIVSNRIKNKALLFFAILVGVLGVTIGQIKLNKALGDMSIYIWIIIGACLAIWVIAYLLFKRREIRN